MNDYRFGNYICEKRKAGGLSQFQLAKLLGVSDKAVSKWENGRAKPTTDTLRKLAALFGVPMDELLQMRQERKTMQIHKIVITGGPSAGKTTGMTWIQNAFTKLGYTVLFVPETATELITGDVAPWTCGTNLDYQKCQMRLQLEKERLFEQAARTMKADKILIVCDRGAMDNRAYMDELEFAQVLADIGATEVELRDSYGAVFHMVTAAKGAERFYTTANNAARYETVAEAAAMDDKPIAAWSKHPRLRVIDNAVDFNEKLKHLIAEIRAFLGLPAPLEIKREFLIELPEQSWFDRQGDCRRVEMVQTYLLAREGEVLWVRERRENGSSIYYKARRRPVGDGGEIEVEETLSEGEYRELLTEADPDRRPVEKTRWCLTHKGQYFEIDVYPFWTDQALAEIELSDLSEEVRFPEEIRVIREVTGERDFTNEALAERQ